MKKEKEEKEAKKEKEVKKEEKKFLRAGTRTVGPIKGSKRSPCGPKRKRKVRNWRI